ncbi:MAG: hypothetical protein AOA65_1406 [Candidatus Bathyarchaeota archaeon BA1]|nr:MAG: hypothetical protein AOA65_1406 [Candidatus Bathyarchaeota archaeon BA1]
MMKVIEELKDIDKRLVEWLMKEGLTSEQKGALIEARADLVRIASRMVVARLLDPKDYMELSEFGFETIEKLTKG